ncbi:MAG: cytochrome c biogenesis protein CcsA [Candidatus Omnitrophica bacterium]|nr:cytochrome c biogenesis protein CcsA [Candidatus Omnitrophota bacterium]
MSYNSVIARRPTLYEGSKKHEADEAIPCLKARLLCSLRSLAMTILVSGFCLPFAHASSAVTILESIPVQYAGRVKPFQSFAEEAVLYVTGKKIFKRTAATKLVWQWMSEPEKWNVEPMIPVSHPKVREDFGLMLVGHRVSCEVVLGHHVFLKEVESAMQRRQKKEKLSLEDQKRVEIYERAIFFREIGEGKIPGWVAHPENLSAGWLPFQGIVSEQGKQTLSGFFPEDKISRLSNALQEVLAAFRQNPESPEAAVSAAEFSLSLEDLFASRGMMLDRKILSMEVTYNHLHPFRWAWIFYFTSVLFFLFFAGIKKNQLAFGTSLAAFLAGFFMHSYGFYLRCQIAGRPPVTNMYESMIWVSWAVILFSLILSLIYRASFIRNVAASLAGFALVLAGGFPVALDPTISPLVPVLRSNLWLSVHVLTITLSYGAFFLAWGLGHAVIAAYAFSKQKETPIKFSQYLYRTLQIGVILLAAGTVLGGVWASYSWGRFWGWDPKETWALIALLGYLTVLHGRFTGWLGAFGIAMGSVIAFLGVLMAWYGVNYVLAAGLHSYGFGGGGLHYVLLAILIDLCTVSFLAIIYKRKSRLIAS